MISRGFPSGGARSTSRERQSLQGLRGRFGRFDGCTVQNEEYADAFRALGAGNVVVTGSVKYDGVNFERNNERTRELRRLFNIATDDLVWIAGSSSVSVARAPPVLGLRSKRGKLLLEISRRMQ